MKFLVSNCKLSIFILFLFIFIFSYVNNKQSPYGDLTTNFAVVELDNPLNIQGCPILEKNSVIIEPYDLKLIFTPLQKFHLIKMTDIVVFNNFEVLFDMNLLTKNIFGILDKTRHNKVYNILDKLRLRFGQGSENCRFIFSNNVEAMTNVNLLTTTVNTLNQVHNLNPYLSLNMNIFCFSSIDMAITFNSQLMSMFNDFVGSMNANHLIYFNKMKMNNLKVIFRNQKMNVLSNIAGSEIDYGLNQADPFANLSNYNLQYGFLYFSKDGALFTDSPGEILKNVLYSFSYDSIKDCQVRMSSKSNVLPKQMLFTETNKCCLSMKIDVKDVYDNILNICSYKHSLYQCNLEIKFIQDSLQNKCAKKLLFNINYAYDNDFNIREYIQNFSSFSQDFIFHKIYQFILSKTKLGKFLPKEKQMLIDVKLTRMIQELGLSFQNFIKENSLVSLDTVIVEEFPIHHSTTIDFAMHHEAEPHLLPPEVSEVHVDINPLLPKNSILVSSPIPKSNIFQLCENHPKMKDCICAAFPLSHICKKEYCLNHPNFYECSPNYCLAKPEDREACKCKFTPFDIECKCRLNPIRKECFCLKYPESAFCTQDFCKQVDNDNEIYCVCVRNPFAPECKPAYCYDNKFDSRCTCLLYPEKTECKRYNQESHERHQTPERSTPIKKNLQENPDKYIINSEKATAKELKIDSQCHKDDIFCTCKNHPHYEQCVCLAFPQADICKEEFCEDEKNKNNYECDPINNCKSQMHNSSCYCKSSFDKSCMCKLTPLSKDCFCSKYKDSHFCNEQNCKFEASTVFCKCLSGEKQYCDPNFCHFNPNLPKCQCILNPESEYCRCLNDPSKCSRKFY